MVFIGVVHHNDLHTVDTLISPNNVNNDGVTTRAWSGHNKENSTIYSISILA